MMLKLLGAASIVALTSGMAHAADLYGGSVKDAAPAHDCCASPNWRGFYVGIGVGGAALLNDIKADFFGVAGAEVDSFSGDGIFGTVQAGFDVHLTPRFVAGLFADYDFGRQSARVILDVPGLTSGDLVKLEKRNSFALGGRFGFLAHNTLWYVPVGYAQADIDLTVPPAGYKKNNTHSGWFIGAGAETQLHDRISLKMEYRYTQYDSQCLFCEGGVDVKNEPTEHSVRGVLSYKFDLGSRHHAEVPMK